jgi:hypothetical protein
MSPKGGGLMTRVRRLRTRIDVALDTLEALGDEKVPEVSDWGPDMRSACEMLLGVAVRHGHEDLAWMSELISRLEEIAENLEEKIPKRKGL